LGLIGIILLLPGRKVFRPLQAIEAKARSGDIGKRP